MTIEHGTSAGMPPIEDFLQLPTERDATHWQDAHRFLEAAISKDILSIIQKWLTVQSEFGKLIGHPSYSQYKTLHDGWRSEVLGNYEHHKEKLKADFRKHIEGGSDPLKWTPWETLDVPSFEIRVEELLTAQVVMAESRTYGERIAPLLTGLIAHTIAYGEWDVLTQIAVSAVIQAGKNASD